MDHRHQPVDGERVACFRRFSRIKLLPERAEILRLCRRQQPEDALAGRLFALPLRADSLCVVGKGIAGVDFDKIVDEQYAHGVVDIDRRSRVFGQYQRQKRHVPTVLGAVFAPAAVGQ